MNDVIAPKRSSLRPKLIEEVMFLKLDMSPNNSIDVMESLIRNTLISSRPKLPDDIDDSNDNENEEGDDNDDDDDDDEDDDLSLVLVESEEADYTCCF